MKQVFTRLKRRLPEDEDLLGEESSKESSKENNTETLDTTKRSKLVVYSNLRESTPDFLTPDFPTSETPYSSFMGQSPPLFANTRTMCYLETDSGRRMTAITCGVGFEINHFVQFINAHKQPDMKAIQHNHISSREKFQYPIINHGAWKMRIPSATYVLPSVAVKLSRMYKLHGFVQRLGVLDMPQYSLHRKPRINTRHVT
jgi:hypothetical protein